MVFKGSRTRRNIANQPALPQHMQKQWKKQVKKSRKSISSRTLADLSVARLLVPPCDESTDCDRHQNRSLRSYSNGEDDTFETRDTSIEQNNFDENRHSEFDEEETFETRDTSIERNNFDENRHSEFDEEETFETRDTSIERDNFDDNRHSEFDEDERRHSEFDEDKIRHSEFNEDERRHSEFDEGESRHSEFDEEGNRHFGFDEGQVSTHGARAMLVASMSTLSKSMAALFTAGGDDDDDDDDDKGQKYEMRNNMSASSSMSNNRQTSGSREAEDVTVSDAIPKPPAFRATLCSPTLALGKAFACGNLPDTLECLEPEEEDEAFQLQFRPIPVASSIAATSVDGSASESESESESESINEESEFEAIVDNRETSNSQIYVTRKNNGRNVSRSNSSSDTISRGNLTIDNTHASTIGSSVKKFHLEHDSLGVHRKHLEHNVQQGDSSFAHNMLRSGQGDASFAFTTLPSGQGDASFAFTTLPSVAYHDGYQASSRSMSRSRGDSRSRGHSTYEDGSFANARSRGVGNFAY